MSAEIAPTSFAFFPELEALPESSSRLWGGNGVPSFFLTRAWFECLISTGLDPADRVALGALQSKDGLVIALLPARFVGESSAALNSGTLRSLTGPYACLFRPLVAPDADPMRTAHALGRHLGTAVTRRDVIQLDSLDEAWPELSAFEVGLREAGFISAQYDHFGNWSEAVLGRSFEQYLAAREGSLREILRRRRRDLEQQGARYEVRADDEEIEAAIAAYESVYSRSWKLPEPYPSFHAHLIRAAAREGILRLGFCYLGDRPIAVQLWILWNRSATVLKLAHDQEFDRFSPGTVLLAHMIQHVMEHDAVQEIDFGRGDDAYKRRWVARRRQRIGLIAANPRSISGLGVLARQAAGRLASRVKG
jgi:hypothetical protein